ncbi:uncharacterized protein [Clytia hemisphaerica]
MKPRIKVSPRSTTFKCSNCSKDDAQNRCSRCTAVRYCSKECQKAHWDWHKVACKHIRKKIVSVEKEMAKLEGRGKSWRITKMQPYLKERFDLAIGFQFCGEKNDSRLALELCLEHLIDILMFNRGDHSSCWAHIPGMLFLLDEPQEAYDYLKWWQVLHNDGYYDHTKFELPSGDKLKNENIFEDLSELNLSKKHVPWLVSMYMVKYKILRKIEKDKISYESFLLGTHPRVGEDSPIQQIGGVSVILHNIKKCFSPIDKYETIRNQTIQILKFIDSKNKYIIPGFLNYKVLLEQPNPLYVGEGGSLQDQAYGAVWFDIQHWEPVPDIFILTKELYIQIHGKVKAERDIAELPREKVSLAKVLGKAHLA